MVDPEARALRARVRELEARLGQLQGPAPSLPIPAEVTVDNGDGTYDVELVYDGENTVAGSVIEDVQGDNLAVGDRVLLTRQADGTLAAFAGGGTPPVIFDLLTEDPSEPVNGEAWIRTDLLP